MDSRDAETPGAALAAWQQRFLAFVPSKRLIVPELLEHTDHSNPVVIPDADLVAAPLGPAGHPLAR